MRFHQCLELYGNEYMHLQQNPHHKYLFEFVSESITRLRKSINYLMSQHGHIMDKKELSKRLENNKLSSLIFRKFYESPFEYWLNLPSKKKSFFLDITEEEFNNLQTFKVKDFIIIGCPLSTDTDIVVSVPKREDVYLTPDLSDIKIENPDVNLVYIEDGVVKEASKGYNTLTNNIIYYTYKYHSQTMECLVKKPLELDLDRMVTGACKYVLDNLEVLQGDEYKNERVELFKEQNPYVRVEKIRKLPLKEYSEDGVWRDKMKSVIFKYQQCIMLDREVEDIYTKDKLAENEGIMWYLTRGKKGRFIEGTMEKVQKRFNEIELNKEEWKSFRLNLEVGIPNEIVKAMINDLESDYFKSLFLEYCRTMEEYEKLFEIKSFGLENFPKEFLERHILCCDQRSKEWNEARKFYICGSDKKVECKDVEDILNNYVYLIRGCMAEKFVHSSDFSQIFPKSKISSVGMMVEEKGKISMGISPDLFVINEEIIPVEIKCLTAEKYTDSWTRSIRLARKQIKSAVKIGNLKKGMIIFVYWNKGISAEYCLV